MKLFHTSPEKIEKIHENGMFGDCLFFSSEPYYMTMSKKPVVYSIDLDDNDVVSVRDLFDEEIVSRIAEVMEIDEEDAERVLDGRDTAFDHGHDGEMDWWVQGTQGECAKKMGFSAVESQDEQGTVWIVPMFGREKDLVEVDAS
jgi:hypothetical protein